MKIKVNSETLNKALKIAVKVIVSKPSIPILECFKLETKGSLLVITASTGEITVKVPVPIESCDEAGSCAVSGKALTELASLLPNTALSIETENNTMKLIWNTGKRQMSIDEVENYPSFPDLRDCQKFDVSAQELQNALACTIPAICKDDLRPALSGILFDISKNKMRLVATDTRMLSYDTINTDADEDTKLIVTASCANLLKSIINKDTQTVRVSFDKKNICFNLGTVMVQGLTIEGKFPNYESIIPAQKDSTGELTIDKSEIIGMMKRAATCSNTISMELLGLNAVLSAEDLKTGDVMTENCSCNYSGNEMKVNVNACKFLSVLENIPSEKITLVLESPSKPIVARPQGTDDRMLSLIMPCIK